MIILCDTRETKPWKFDIYEGWYSKREKLDAGDYVALGHETKVCIERKASPGEIALNLGKTYNKQRFEREIERALEQYDKFFVLCEFSLQDLYEYPDNLPDYVKEKVVGQNKKTGKPIHLIDTVRAKGPFIVSVLKGLEKKYGIHVIYAGDRQKAQDKAKVIFQALEEEDLF